MKAHTFAAILLVLALPLAGCIGRSDAADSDSGEGPSSDGTGPAADAPSLTAAPSAPIAAALEDGVLPIEIESVLTTYGLLVLDQGTCDPSGDYCDVYGTEMVLLEGPMNGTIVDTGRVRYFTDDEGTGNIVGTQTFTGSVAGCGSGTMTFTYEGNGTYHSTPDMRGWIPGGEDLKLVQGSTTTGFAGIVDARIREDFNISVVNYAGAGIAKGTVWCRTAAVPAPASHDGAVVSTLEGTLFTPGTVNLEWFACEPSAPEDCGEIGGTEMVDVDGGWKGTLVDHAHFHYLDDGSVAYEAMRIFTGSIEGCGSGSLTFLARGTVDATPSTDAPGYQDLHDDQVLAPGSMTTGFAGLVDMQTHIEGVINMATFSGYGTYTATVWCRTADVPAPGAAGAGLREVAVDSTFTSPGMYLVPESLYCDPATPGVCEGGATQLFFLTGTMTGTMLDINRIRVNPDGTLLERAERIFTGTIDGCGSGTMTLEIRGSADLPEPVLTDPGHYHLREAPMLLVPGSTTLGLAGVVDGELTDEGDFHGYVTPDEGRATITGTLWCMPDAAKESPLAPGSSASPGPQTDGERALSAVANAVRISPAP